MGRARTEDYRLVIGWRGTALRTAAAYYGLLGLFGVALAAWFVLSAVNDERVLIPAAVALAVSLMALDTAWRIHHGPAAFGSLTRMSSIVGVGVPALPFMFILAMSDSLRISPVGSIELGPLVFFSVLLLWGLHSAIVVWREEWRFNRR
jgi:hypothetical protein